ncbi:uncharacterized protein C10orf62 homolog [Arvicanthis niloticus]|uniref:uncharacterized protein C10orf62 homolog n=1 Tax=Arvicanthis niloticus TaxID=61156 RepID=UPI001486B9BE|nr:uncharacterized protein C10orf62 homolog [Arvicanthis niloticus]
MLWAQRRKRKATLETTEDKCPESHRANDNWIKSHFSRLSEERLPFNRYVGYNGHSPESRHGEANTTLHMDTLTTKRGEGGAALHRDSFASKHKVSGTSVTKEMQRESGKSPSMEDDTWAAVAACTKDIDAKGHRVANSMLQRTTGYERTGHAESRNISPEELKALEEVEIKLKGNFLTHHETTVAGANQSHTIYSQSRHGNQNHHSYPRHQNNQSHPVSSSHQSYHPSHLSHQGHPGLSSHQGHPGLSSHQGHPGLSSHQSHLGHSNHQGQPGHPSHQSHQGQPGHSNYQSHSLPNRRKQVYDS